MSKVAFNPDQSSGPPGRNFPLPAAASVTQASPRHANMRVIRGRRIIRLQSREGLIWREISDPKPLKTTITGAQGETSAVTEYSSPQILWEAGGDTSQEISRLMEQVRFSEFDPREPSPLHDELDAAVKAGFGALVAEFELRNKVKPRQVLTGLPLGQCYVSRGIGLLPCPIASLRQHLHNHAHGEWGSIGRASEVGELGDDQAWCPSLFGPAIQNAAAVKAGRGLVRSVFPHVYSLTRGSEELKIITLIGHTTLVYAPSRDSCS
jgi:hypothetical protein